MTVDTELDLLFKQSTSAPIKTTIAVQEAIDQLEKPLPVTENEEAKSPEAEAEEEEKLTRKQRKELVSDSAEKTARTLFLGNVPIKAATDKKLARELKNLFTPFGPVESIRFRSIAFEAPGARKVAFIKAEFRKNISTCNAYIVMATREAAVAALSLNATIFADRHLRVDLAGEQDEQGSRMNTKKSIFIGNLSMEIEEEPVWRFFGQVGNVTNVRLIRDRVTNLGKGIGYVTFSSKDSVELAMKLAGSVLEGRPVRVSRCCKAGFAEKKKERFARLAEEKAKKYAALVKPSSTATTATTASTTGTGKQTLGAAKTVVPENFFKPETTKKLSKKEAKLQKELSTKFGQMMHKKFPFSEAISAVSGKKDEKKTEEVKKAKVEKPTSKKSSEKSKEKKSFKKEGKKD